MEPLKLRRRDRRAKVLPISKEATMEILQTALIEQGHIPAGSKVSEMIEDVLTTDWMLRVENPEFAQVEPNEQGGFLPCIRGTRVNTGEYLARNLKNNEGLPPDCGPLGEEALRPYFTSAEFPKGLDAAKTFGVDPGNGPLTMENPGMAVETFSIPLTPTTCACGEPGGDAYECYESRHPEAAGRSAYAIKEAGGPCKCPCHGAGGAGC